MFKKFHPSLALFLSLPEIRNLRYVTRGLQLSYQENNQKILTFGYTQIKVLNPQNVPVTACYVYQASKKYKLLIGIFRSDNFFHQHEFLQKNSKCAFIWKLYPSWLLLSFINLWSKHIVCSVFSVFLSQNQKNFPS